MARTSNKIQWRVVPAFPCYEVSNTGLVRRIEDPAILFPGKMLSVMESRYGPVVSLRQNGVKQRFRVHSLMARAFLGKPPEGLEPCCLDGDKYNLSLENLGYVTRADAIRIGRARKTGARIKVARDGVTAKVVTP